MSIIYWIQNSDFSNPGGHNFESVTDILKVIQDYDWATQNAYEYEHENSCPAGIGIVKPGGFILHICPEMKSETALIHLHHERPAKIFGLFKTTKDIVNTFTQVPFSEFETTITQFIAGHYDRICEDLAGYMT